MAGIPTPKDAAQVLRYSFDDDTNSIRTNATFSGSVTVDLDQADDSVAIGDGTELYTGTDVGPSHAIDANVVQSVLPTGAATSANQTTANASLSAINGKLNSSAEGYLHVSSISMFTKPYDAITVTYPSGTQEIYVTHTGGTGGTIIETVTVNYTDTSKNFILNAARS